jgi:hypothetical protein
LFSSFHDPSPEILSRSLEKSLELFENCGLPTAAKDYGVAGTDGADSEREATGRR